MAPPPGPTELKGRRAAEPAGDDVRALNEPVVCRDCDPASIDCGLIVRFMLYLPALDVERRSFLKLLDESLSFRNTLGFTAGFVFLVWGATGVNAVDGNPAEAARV